ncbi:MAG: SDR family oxidoreductase [Gemmatimonadota bacterium]
MILVVGATGLVGGTVSGLLRQAGKPVRALVRSTADPAKLESLQRSGASLVLGDLKDADSLSAACRGVDTVITTASATVTRQAGDSLQSVDHDGQVRLMDAARAAGVSRFIHTSYSHNITADCPLTTAKRTVEAHLKRSGMNYTILAPSFYMEVWLGPHLGFDAANAKATIYGTGKNPISWISFADVARFAAIAVDHPAARNATIELGGPEALSPLDVVALFERIGGRAFGVQHVDEDTLRDNRAAATDPLQQSFAALMLAYAKGDAIEMGQTLKTMPVQMVSVSQYAGSVLTTAPEA